MQTETATVHCMPVVSPKNPTN